MIIIPGVIIAATHCPQADADADADTAPPELPLVRPWLITETPCSV
jgi:hypothetical protein